MSRRSDRQPGPVVRFGERSAPLLLRVQRRATRLGADTPSPRAIPHSAQTDPRVAASHPARRMPGSARCLACSRPPQLHPAPIHGSPFCEWHRRLTLAATRPRSLRCPIPCSPRHVCRSPRPGATRPGRSRSPEYRHLPTLHLGASHHRRMLAAIPRLQPHQATATARRPSNDIVQPRSTLRAIAPVACIASSFIVSPVAKCRYVPLSPALHARLGQRLPDPPRRRAVKHR